jgi:hypothetical protein
MPFFYLKSNKDLKLVYISLSIFRCYNPQTPDFRETQ